MASQHVLEPVDLTNAPATEQPVLISPPPMQPYPGDTCGPEAQQDALQQALERHEILLRVIEELETTCADLTNERDELQATLEDMVMARMAALANAPTERESVGDTTLAPPESLVPESLVPESLVDARGQLRVDAPRPDDPVGQTTRARPLRRPRVATAAFRTAFGERRLSLIADDPPDDIDYLAARSLRASRFSLPVIGGMVAVLVAVAFLVISGAQQLENDPTPSLMEKFSTVQTYTMLQPADESESAD